jgi:hypothetical protein
MTFTYTGAPTTDDLVELTRLWLGDRDKDNPIFSDTEIEVVLQVQSSPVQAAASLACARMAEVARKVTKKIGRTSINSSDEYKHWKELAEKLENAGSGLVPNQGSGLGGVLVGGLTKAERQELATDNVYDPFRFEIGQDDHPDTSARDADHGRDYDW